MKENEFNSVCAICGTKEKLSFEHIPPKSALNSKPIFIQNGENMFERRSRLYEKKKRSPKGFGRYSLCESCNNKTGAWYGNEFISFINQHLSVIMSCETPKENTRSSYTIKPLNVIKQICAMFMSTDTSGYFRDKGFTDFILNKESQSFPIDFNLYIYSNISPIKRLLGLQTVYNPNLGIQKWSEISFPPLGYFLAENSQPAHEKMVDITAFADFKFGQEATVEIITSFLKIDNPMIGFYSEY